MKDYKLSESAELSMTKPQVAFIIAGVLSAIAGRAVHFLMMPQLTEAQALRVLWPFWLTAAILPTLAVWMAILERGPR